MEILTSMRDLLLLDIPSTEKNTERLQTWDDEDPGPPRKKLRAQINDRKRTVTFNDNDLPPPKKGKGWGSQKPSQSSVLGFENNGQSLSQTQKGPSCASHYNQHEWTAAVSSVPSCREPFNHP